uniref:Uncharacterized protein n=1 Tax=Kalanchoe fedtschenkoi TaxID=63787 RepID=A0A7N0R929_KALFE
MERMIDDLRSLESIRKAMLEHDRIFRQQVEELHRVYGVQKMLMNEVKHKLRFSAQSRGHGPPPKVASGCSFSAPVLKSYPCFKETSGSCSGENQIKPGCSDLERPAYKVDTAALKNGQRRHKETESSHNRSRHDDDEEEGADVELTLSIGVAKNCSQRMKKTQQPHCSNTDLLYSKSNSDHYEVKVKNGSSSAVEEPEPGSGVERSDTVTSDQDRKRPRWLFRSLSLHET